MRKLLCIFAIVNILAVSAFAEPMTEVSEPLSEAASEAGGEAEPQGIEITAETAVVIDPETGILLYDKNGDKEMYPASITKIMTSLLAIEYAESEGHSFDEVVTHSHNAVYNIGPGSSHIGMREGEQITLDQALYGILLASANEVCMAVAEHIDGSVDAFVDRMNARAKELGATHTHFANPHGFHDDAHYTSAHDIALIMAEAVKHKDFIRYISTYEYQIGFTNMVQEVRYLHNSNKLINPYSNYLWAGCIGGKTGFTDEAGNTLVVYGGNGEHKFISAVMKEPGRDYSYKDSRALIEYVESLYTGEKVKIFSADDSLGEINILKDGAVVGKASVSPAEDLDMELISSISSSDIKFDVVSAENFEAPLGIGKSAGMVYAFYNDRLLASSELSVSSVTDADGAATEFLSLDDAAEEAAETGVFNTLLISGGVVLLLIVSLAAALFISRAADKRNREKRLKMKSLERRERRRANLEKRLKQAEEDDT